MENSTQTLTLTDFLLARIAERRDFWEVVGEARQAHPDQVRRNLAQCAALKSVVERLVPEVASEPQFCSCLNCRNLQDLAAVYSDHPDYRVEWAA